MKKSGIKLLLFFTFYFVLFTLFNEPKFSNSQVLANVVDPDQTASKLEGHYSIVRYWPFLSNVSFKNRRFSNVSGFKIANIHCESKKEGKDQESIQSSTTPDRGHHMGK